MKIKLLLTIAAIFSTFIMNAQSTLRLDASHWLVDANAKESSPYIFDDFDNLNKAIKERGVDELTVYINPWVYWIDNPDDTTIRRGNPPIGMTIKCRKLTLIGTGKTADETVLACQRGQSQGADGNFTMLDFHCEELTVRNLTLGDYLNVDLVYKPNPQLSRKKRSDVITQGQLAFMQGKRLMAEGCRFVSRLNLCPIVGADGSHYTSCHFESTDDALNGNARYDSCDFDFYGSRPLYTTSGQGATFVNCTFNIRHSGEQYFTKRPGKVKVIDCKFLGAHTTYIGWSGAFASWLRNYQTGNTLNGKPLLIESQHPETSACKGNGTYKAEYITSYISQHEATLQSGRDSLLLKASAITRENVSLPISWTVEKGFEQFISIKPQANGQCIIIPQNHTTEEKRFCIIASALDSLAMEACELTVLPQERPVPIFLKEPIVEVKGNTAVLNYQLDLDGTKDESKVKWYRVTSIPGSDEYVSEEVAESHNGPLLTYRLRPADVGSWIEALVYPKSNCSSLSTDFEVAESKLIKPNDIASPYILETDFSDLPGLNPLAHEDNWSACRFKPDDTKDYEWDKDDPAKYSTPWYYGHGTGGCKDSLGLLQNIQGSRLVYHPKNREYGNISLELDVTPAKTAGQGFSSNRMQYMDVCIKYNNATMTGYGVRVIRTLKHGNAVDFQLMKFTSGKAEPVSEAVSSTCYRGNCKILLSYENGVLNCQASTDAAPSTVSLPNEVNLTAKVQPNDYGDFVIQHTGTTGEGQTMLRHLRIDFGK